MKSLVKILQEKGVTIPAPESVEIGVEVNPERISGDNVMIHAGCRIFGADTLILPCTELGAEAPVTLDNCRMGPKVRLNGGFFKQAVFLSGASAGSGAHVREGTVLEEEASIAHTVGLKQTILFPFVTLGSLINFCDCLMSGGTDRINHSEVGSSYIHFNYTPHQDKATPSLIGDVPAGVMLNQPPIFLGGQGGLVGPCRLAHGTVIAAGTIQRKDELRPGRLLYGGAAKSGNVAYSVGRYSGVKRIIGNNVVYIGNLIALLRWVEHVRKRFVAAEFPEALHEGLIATLHVGLNERIKRLLEFLNKIPDLSEGLQDIPDILVDCHRDGGKDEIRDAFLKQIDKAVDVSGKAYIDVIKGLDPTYQALGTRWLQGIVDGVVAKAGV